MLRDTVDVGSSVQFRQDPSTGILTFWDTSRSMFIGVDREKYEYGINHKTISSNMWMMITSRIKTLANGSLISRDALITCISVNTKNLTDGDFVIYINGSPMTSITLANEDKKVDDSLSISLNANDIISVLCKPLNNKKVDYPALTIEIAWR